MRPLHFPPQGDEVSYYTSTLYLCVVMRRLILWLSWEHMTSMLIQRLVRYEYTGGAGKDTVKS